jgi:hypothetical protein
METANGVVNEKKHPIIKILLKMRLPLATIAVGILIGVFLTAYISPIMETRNKIVPIQSVIAQFCPIEQSNLENVPIKTGNVVSAMAQTTQVVPLNNVDILVNYAFATYSLDFQTELMTHEYLHILQAEDPAINIQAFHLAVQLWFNDFNSGLPIATDNYTKYYVYYELYSSGRYTLSDYPREEYAYIGTMLTEGRQADVPENIQAYYRGVLNAVGDLPGLN